MSKTFIWITIIIIISCSNNNFEKNIICTDNEYWKYIDDCYKPKGLYFKFKKDYTCDRYLSKPINEGKGFYLFNKDGDIEFEDNSWGVKNDSTFLWGDGYKIESFKKDTVILSFKYLKNKKCNVTLVKVYDSLK